MEDHQSEQQKSLPFKNLYLNAGIVHGKNEAWMYFLGFSLALLGYFLYQNIIAVFLVERLISKGYSLQGIVDNPALLFDSTALGLNMNLVLLMELGMFVLAALGLWLAVVAVHRKPFTSVLTAYEKFRFSRFWTAFGIWALLLIVITGIDYLLEPASYTLQFDAQGWLLSAAIMLVLMPIQTGFEEVFFRGYLMQGLAQLFKNGWLPMLIMCGLFAAAHMDNPEVKEHGALLMYTYYLAFALFLGFLTLLDEGLELAFGIHFANNLISSLLVTTDDAVIKTYSIWKSESLDPLTEMLVWAGMALLAFFILRAKYRWKNYSILIK